MIQLQNLHLCIFSAKWEEGKKKEAIRREATQEDTSASSAAQPRKGGAESVEGRKDNACHLIIRT